MSKMTSGIGLSRGGTEMVAMELLRRLGHDLPIRLCLNTTWRHIAGSGPTVVWFQQAPNQPMVQWLRDDQSRISRFIFVSEWQRGEYLKAFNLDPKKCVVLENATNCSPNRKAVGQRPVCVYASTPFRGLNILLACWELLRPPAELHIFSSMKIYDQAKLDGDYEELYALARSLPGVHYYGTVPHEELQTFWSACDLLTYPNTFAECNSVAVIEAQASGVRVIAPRLGSLPEQTHGFARLYDYSANTTEHALAFAQALMEELERPWEGQPMRALEQQAFFRQHYDWDVREAQWRQFLALFEG